MNPCKGNQPKRRRSHLGASLLLTALISSTSALAQAQEPTPAPAPQNDAAKDERLAEARRQFDAGVSLLDDPDGARYEQAYAAFRRAYELSKSPKVLGNIGFCAMKLERDGEAIDTYTQYLREVTDIDEREKVQIQKDVLTLTSTVGRMQITVKHPPAKFTLVDHRNQTRGDAIENAYPFEGTDLSIRLRPGRHTLKINAGTEESIPFDVTIEPGGTAQHDFTFPVAGFGPDEGPRRKSSVVGPVILGAIGVAGIGTGVVTGILARSRTSKIETACPNDTCPTTYALASNRTKAKTLGTIADISFISGGALLGGALIWYVLLPSASDSQRTRASRSTAGSWLSSTTAMCTSDGCNMSLQRGF